MKNFLTIIILFFCLNAIYAQADDSSEVASIDDRCDNYAKSAVLDYLTMKKSSGCLVRDNSRWQNNYQSHYKWCLAVAPKWPAIEADIRNTYLVNCGARQRL